MKEHVGNGSARAVSLMHVMGDLEVEGSLKIEGSLYVKLFCFEIKTIQNWM